jgi:glutathione S-transferase
MTATLLTIPFSHYCEKARWALELCGVPYVEDGHLPLFHYAAVRRAGAKRTVPILIDGSTKLTDSTDIIAFADAKKPGALLGPPEALALEDDFDTHLGPAARRWGYFQLLPRRDMDELITKGVPRWQARAFKLARPVMVALLKRGLNVTPAGAARSEAKLDETFARTSELLADGRPYLCGDRFSVADLTLASLGAPVLQPPEHPFALPPSVELSATARAKVTEWRATRAGKHAMKMYATRR